MKPSHPLVRRNRAAGAGLILGLLFLVLVGAFFRSQVLGGTAWALQSDSNRLRVLPVPAPRGTIFDRYGEVIADNVPSYSLSLFPASPDSVAEVLGRLQPILDLSEERVETLNETFRQNRRRPLVVTMNLSDAELAVLEELRPEFPGVFLEMRPRRRYLGGEALGHIMGYVGEVSAGELESPRFEGYERGMIVGKDGLERQYEAELQGAHGVRYAEVDAAGRVVGSFQGQAARPALPGDDLYLNLDLGLQHYIHSIFPEGMRGAVVALNVEDGGVLALYSAPSFDPGDFVGGISRDRWQAFNEDPDQPLYNRAVVGRYPPASTWKLASAAIALEAGVVTPDERMAQPCTGSIFFQGRTWRCHRAGGHGYQNLAGAIATSCNVYFYQMGLRVGLERMVEEGHRLGFGDRCGIDLPQESVGVFPEGLEYWQRNWGYRPAQNEVLSIAIGHGPNDQTPLRMAQFYLALARQGDAPAPRILRDDAAAIEPAWAMDLTPESLEALRDGLRAVTRPGGTAFLRTALEHWDIIGKTGTARLTPDRPPHAWFTGMAGPWGQDPEIVIVVLVEEGESGSAAAAPVAAKAADFHLRRKYGIPVDTIQTLFEHQMAGIPAPWAWNRDAVAVPALPEGSASDAEVLDPSDLLGPRPLEPTPRPTPVPPGADPQSGTGGGGGASGETGALPGPPRTSQPPRPR
jgi:penicillin-binding protein 2